ncbi:LysM domain-containing protein [Ammoniphilus sp. YIM 78166]|uniref:LysM peptidoglycan-binding domain-containing protein n=1 Tax=Ammoniphilus sp. YIM 78166 TaxID=1644106 RepID=UPI001430E564|nr:LysM domain-containing protein [Ammoniphilus sp. YIM 78166]
MLSTYIAKKGDTIWELAERLRVDLRTLVNLNPHIRDPDDIPAGTKVNLPTAAYPGMPPHPGDPYAVHPYGASPVPAYPVMTSPYHVPQSHPYPHYPVQAPLANAPVPPPPQGQVTQPLDAGKQPTLPDKKSKK